MKRLLFILFWGSLILTLGKEQAFAQQQVLLSFKVPVSDSLTVLVKSVLSQDQLPIQYTAFIETPVCADSLCHIMNVTVYWDLLGNFLKYEMVPDNPLTKFDHEELTAADHEKLYAILGSKDSPLRDYKKQDLIDHNITQTSQQIVDGVSGATNTSILPYIVEGALYSTYTLWHIVNGEIASKIEKTTLLRMSESLLTQFLHSESYHEQYYALSKLVKIDEETGRAIAHLIRNGKAYVPFFAVDKLPLEYWHSAINQEIILEDLKRYDFALQNEIINKLKTTRLTQQGATLLILNCLFLKDAQIRNVLKIIIDNGIAIRASAENVVQDLQNKTSDVKIRELLADLVFSK